MENLIIPKNDEESYYPYVFFNHETGICEIGGESYMESPDIFYKPIMEWLYNFFENNTKPLEFIIKLRYYNTASSKFIIELLKILTMYLKKGSAVNIKWYVHPEDIDMEEEIEDLSKESGIKIEPIFEV